jgi:hypothetical protein
VLIARTSGASVIAYAVFHLATTEPTKKDGFFGTAVGLRDY